MEQNETQTCVDMNTCQMNNGDCGEGYQCIPNEMRAPVCWAPQRSISHKDIQTATMLVGQFQGTLIPTNLLDVLSASSFASMQVRALRIPSAFISAQSQHLHADRDHD